MTDRAALVEKANELGLELEITSTFSGFEYTIRSSEDDGAAIAELMDAIDAADPSATYVLPWKTGGPEPPRWAI
ncbi:MAG: hypothetical protein F4Y27_04915 [Acidimicrobiaceae bacterium]|nr:hypothetical protein [Acidimicrobiaceae bacterium]MYG55881.1 hypothetical protein [Acidimicrobiaceae bacterium]MYJ99516.1 hypothetical protein [Acidimicrobiaceae bacterium]